MLKVKGDEGGFGVQWGGVLEGWKVKDDLIC
jgi:hypothetical protein